MSKKETIEEKRSRLSPAQMAALNKKLQGAASLQPRLAAIGEAISLPEEGRSDRSVVIKIQPRGTNPPFICVHGGGGGILSYLPLARALDTRQPFYGLESLLLHDPELKTVSLEQLAARHLEALRAEVPRGPYLLGGWSMGGVLAFEMARQLQALGEPLALLVLIDCLARPPAEIPIQKFESMLIGGYAMELGLSFERIKISWEHFWTLQLEAQLAYLLNQVEQVGELPEGLNFSRARRLLHAFLINTRAMLAYSPGTYAGRVILLHAAEQPAHRVADQTGGWSEFVTGGFERFSVPGNHTTILREPNVNLLAARLQEALEQILAETEPSAI